MAWPVRALMFLTAPVSWPISRVLDWVLGGAHTSRLRRRQLKALVSIHSRDEAFGGKLTQDEIRIITGEGGVRRGGRGKRLLGVPKGSLLTLKERHGLQDVIQHNAKT